MRLKKNLEYINIINVDNKTLEQIRIWRNLPEIRKYMCNDHIINREEHLDWVKKFKKKNDSFFWIAYLGKKPIGIINLKDVDYKNKTTNWGIYIGEKNYRGKGIAKNMLFDLMSHVFDEMKLNKMYTSVLECNSNALNFYKKFGFEEEMNIKKHLIRDNKKVKLIFVSILQNKWINIKEKLKQKYNLFPSILN